MKGVLKLATGFHDTQFFSYKHIKSVAKNLNFNKRIGVAQNECTEQNKQDICRVLIINWEKLIPNKITTKIQPLNLPKRNPNFRKFEVNKTQTASGITQLQTLKSIFIPFCQRGVMTVRRI